MTVGHPAPSSTTEDEAAVIGTIEDYFLGWYDGDPERMTRALHPDLAKRSHVADGATPPVVRGITANQMIVATAAGRGRRAGEAERRLGIRVDEIHGSIATARVDSVPYREYVHLVRTPDGWRIINTLWTSTDGDDAVG
jgi:putative lumazine-binding protein